MRLVATDRPSSKRSLCGWAFTSAGVAFIKAKGGVQGPRQAGGRRLVGGGSDACVDTSDAAGKSTTSRLWSWTTARHRLPVIGTSGAQDSRARRRQRRTGSIASAAPSSGAGEPGGEGGGEGEHHPS